MLAADPGSKRHLPKASAAKAFQRLGPSCKDSVLGQVDVTKSLVDLQGLCQGLVRQANMTNGQVIQGGFYRNYI